MTEIDAGKERKNKVYVALFDGQGGAFTSWGMGPLRDAVAAVGTETDLLPWQDYREADAKITTKLAAGYKVALVGYSLGASTVTYLQTIVHPIALVVAIAESRLAQNYRIIDGVRMTARSILFTGPDFLSSADSGGFTEVIKLDDLHLFMDTDPRVKEVVIVEVKKLVES